MLGQKASVYKNQFITENWYVSEKLDGMWALWDGGLTVGMDTRLVPWANNEKGHSISTGLWSSRGKVIHAPADWTARLGSEVMEGELWMGRGMFQQTMSICRAHSGRNWGPVDYKVYSFPRIDKFLVPRTIEYGEHRVYMVGLDDFLSATQGGLVNPITGSHVVWLKGDWARQYHHSKYEGRIEQVRLGRLGEAHYAMKQYLDEIVSRGGEGIVIRDPYEVWMPRRSKQVLKWKPYLDAEGVVVGYTEGKGKHEGRLGALVVDYTNNGVVSKLRLSGFTDQERENAKELFPLGSVITFKYRELSDDGVPKEARYWRKRC